VRWNRIWTFLVFLVVSTTGCGASATALAVSAPSSPSPSVTMSDVPSDQQLLDQRVKGMPGVGIILGVVDNHNTSVYMAGTSGTSRPLDDHTLFEIGSVTKTFTATILAEMVMDRSVGLDDPVAKYLPANTHVPSLDGKQITLLNLATQHSGLPRLPTNLKPADPDDPYADYTIGDLYRFLDSYTLTRDPGEQFEYSNVGIGLLGDALARREHTSYAQLLGTKVLSRLDMHETTTSLASVKGNRLAAGHDADGDPVKPWTFQAIAPTGAIISSMSDMLKYLRANMWQEPLVKACLFAQEPRETLPGARIGLVWLTQDVSDIVWHNGSTDGYQAAIAISPDHQKGAVVLTNGGISPDDIAMHAIDPDFAVAQVPMSIPMDATALESYVGTYIGPENLTFTLTVSDDRLMAQLSGQHSYRIYPSGKDHFFYRVVDAQIDFKRGAGGVVSALVLHQDGKDLTFVHPGMTATP
jgi:serine-type D-Ala-D-Ala carboxypeptidase/endopeptidase